MYYTLFLKSLSYTILNLVAKGIKSTTKSESMECSNLYIKDINILTYVQEANNLSCE